MDNVTTKEADFPHWQATAIEVNPNFVYTESRQIDIM